MTYWPLLIFFSYKKVAERIINPISQRCGQAGGKSSCNLGGDSGGVGYTYMKPISSSSSVLDVILCRGRYFIMCPYRRKTRIWIAALYKVATIEI